MARPVRAGGGCEQIKPAIRLIRALGNVYPMVGFTRGCRLNKREGSLEHRGLHRASVGLDE
jgi:hypothetical protein